MTAKESFNTFLRKKRLQGLRPKSIEDYRLFVGMFINYVGQDYDIESLSEAVTESYIEYQMSRGIAQSTIATYVRNLKIYLLWMEKQYHISVSASDIIVPKTEKTCPLIYSEEQIELIFSSIHNESPWITLRNRSIVALMLDSGLRQSEVCNLHKADINYDAHTIKVHGKGGKERLVPIGSFSEKYITEYLATCPHPSDSLFVGRRGDNLTPDSVKHLISKIGKCLPFPFSSHKLRHNFATNYCLDQYEKHGQIDVYSLMILMGHEDVKTTERYLHFAKQIIASRQHISHLDAIFVA